MKNLLPVLFALLILSSCRKKEENIAVESVTIDKGKTSEVHLGRTLELKATVLPENATSKEVTWNSSAPSIATVSGGIVTPVKEGETIISATAGGVTANCTVKVLPPFVAVAGISLDHTTVSILIEKTSTLKAVIAPENASDKTVVWSSDNENIATVSDGVITAKKEVGTCKITAKSFSDQTKVATCEVKVVDKEIPVTGISVDPVAATLLLNGTRELAATITPKDATNKNVTWSTSNANVAEVSATGVVTAKSKGSATITVTSVGNKDKTAACAITVTDQKVAVTGISVAPADTTLITGKSFQLRHTITPAEATNGGVTYESSGDAKATVSKSGLVTAGSTPGEAIITVKSVDNPDKKAACKVTITKGVGSITVSSDATSLLVGQKRQLTALVMPDNAANKAVTWSSSDESKATVSTSGEVTAVAAGDARIIATAADGSGVTGEVKITVQANSNPPTATITGITLGTENFVVAVPKPGQTTTLNNAPRTIAGNLAEVQVNITTTDGAIIQIGGVTFTSGNKANFNTNSVTFSLTQEGKTGSIDYTLTIPAYNKESNPYGIYSVAHLHDVRNALGAGFKLMNDLTMPAATAGLPGIDNYGTEGWLPIGSEENPFTGKLDGGEHKIENFYIKRTTKYVGLFGRTGSGASIKNLEVKGMEGEGSGDNHFFSVTGTGANVNLYTGILVGFNEGRIEYCHTSGDLSCVSTGSADIASVGGLVGYSKGNTISHCYTLGNINSSTAGAEAKSGGLVGHCEGTAITDCYTSGNVTSYSSSTFAISGGLAGNCNNGTTISRSYATGVIVSSSDSNNDQKGAIAGGLVGGFDEISTGSCSAIDCFATGNILTVAPQSISASGGLIGAVFTGIVRNCYATGNVTSVTNVRYFFVGLLIGYDHEDKSTVENSYRNSTAIVKRGTSSASSGTYSLRGTPKSLSDMQSDSFTNTLGNSVWGRDGNKNNKLPFIKGVGVGK